MAACSCSHSLDCSPPPTSLLSESTESALPVKPRPSYTAKPSLDPWRQGSFSHSWNQCRKQTVPNCPKSSLDLKTTCTRELIISSRRLICWVIILCFAGAGITFWRDWWEGRSTSDSHGKRNLLALLKAAILQKPPSVRIVWQQAQAMGRKVKSSCWEGSPMKPHQAWGLSISYVLRCSSPWWTEVFLLFHYYCGKQHKQCFSVVLLFTARLTTRRSPSPHSRPP